MSTRLARSVTLTARRRLWAGLVLFAAGLAVAPAQAQGQGNSLTAVETSRSSGEVMVLLTLTQDAPIPSVFTVDEPPRLSLDLPNTGLSVAQRYNRVEMDPVEAVALAHAGDRTRVVIELERTADYRIDRQGNQIMVAVATGATGATGANGATAAPAEREPAPATPSSSARAAAPAVPDNPYAPAVENTASGPSVTNIDFRRGEDGAGRIALTLDDVDVPIDVRETGGAVVALLQGVSLPAALAKRYDVMDFATPVRSIEARDSNGSTRIVINPVDGADFEQMAYQTGDQFFIEIAPVTASEQARREENAPSYEGERISLSFQNIDVQAVLQIIADVADVNMVVSDSVSGNMALRLEDVPWDQALDIILQAKGLGMRRENNVIMVAPLAEIAAREQAELAAKQATTNLAPLRSEIIQINYARAGEIAALLRSTGGELSLLSERGQVTVDERTNSLLVNETREKLDEIRSVISRLDIPVRQVLIESRIVVANRDFSRNLGVSSAATDNAAYETGTGGNYLVDSGYTVSLPAANPAGTITTSIVGDTFNLDLALSALETENRGEIISSPRVITANAKEAKIEQGVEIPYLEAASSGAATVEFKEAVLGLTVTPQITPDERVIMDLFVTQDTQGDVINVQGGGSVPSINTRNLTTQVLVDDGETVVLGGIYEQENRDVADRIPILGELPLVGGLFRRTSRQRDKRELLLFVTPRILREDLTLNR